MDIDVTSFFNEENAWDFSHSIMEGGPTAGKDTWNAAKEMGASKPLLDTPEKIEALRRYVKDFGAWSDDEIAAWDETECNALFIQLVSGDMREGGLDNDPDDDAWAEYEKGAEDGRHGGNIHRHDGRVYYSLSH